MIHPMKSFIIEENDIQAIEFLARRLHSEDRMNGDTMRDFGHCLTQIARKCREIEIPIDIGPSY
jgi:hypothetical protein